MLILDGHISHTLFEFFETALANRLCLLFLPAHATHLMQPLDLVIFGAIKRRFHDELYKRTSNGTLTITLQVFFQIYASARLYGISARNCRAGFKLGGIIPVNMSIPLSQATHPEISLSPPLPTALPPSTTPNISQMDGRAIHRQLLALYDAGSRRDLALFGHELGVRIDRLEARQVTNDTRLERQANQIQSYEQPRLTQRRVPLSPNRSFLTTRAIARSRGMIMSSPLLPAVDLEGRPTETIVDVPW
jgi:hypothetical protein